MSALIIGEDCNRGAVCDLFLGYGFDEVQYRDSSSVDKLDLMNYGPLNMLVLLQEAVEGLDLREVFNQAAGLDIPLTLL